MFLKEQGDEPLNTQFLQGGGHGLPAVRMGGEEKVHIESQVRKTPARAHSGLFVAGRDPPGRQWTLSSGITKQWVGQSLLERHRCLPGVDRV